MTSMCASSDLSSWASCPGSICQFASGASDCCAMDPRDKPWDDTFWEVAR